MISVGSIKLNIIDNLDFILTKQRNFKSTIKYKLSEKPCLFIINTVGSIYLDRGRED
jgi:hypothetical protein